MQRDFLVSVSNGPGASTIACAGEIDVYTSPRLQQTIDSCLESRPRVLRIYGGGITLLASAGIRTLLYGLQRCRELDIDFDLRLSPEARRVLDIVGLEWLGAEDVPADLDSALAETLQRYGGATVREDDGVD